MPAGPVATDAEFAALLGRPIPVPVGQRPFTRNSTPTDLETSRAGRRLVAAMRWGMPRQFAANNTDNMDDMVEAVLASLPLRAVVMMSTGMSFADPRPDHRRPERRPARGHPAAAPHRIAGAR